MTIFKQDAAGAALADNQLLELPMDMRADCITAKAALLLELQRIDRFAVFPAGVLAASKCNLIQMSERVMECVSHGTPLKPLFLLAAIVHRAVRTRAPAREDVKSHEYARKLRHCPLCSITFSSASPTKSNPQVLQIIHLSVSNARLPAALVQQAFAASFARQNYGAARPQGGGLDFQHRLRRYLGAQRERVALR